MSESLELEVAKRLMGRPEFISYDGKHPNLCSGTLVIRVQGKVWEFDPHSLSSGGGLDSDYNAFEGPWSVDKWPEGFPDEYKGDVVRLVNEFVEHGCCGGCE